MKQVITLIAVLLVVSDANAQAPQGIPYQAVARNSSGVVLASTAIRVRFTIHDSVATGSVVYQETFNPTTSTQGLFNVNVGTGTVSTGTFSGTNWGHNAKFMQVEMDPTGGTSYVDMGTQQMMSVPYALYAGSLSASAQLQPHIQVFTSSGIFTTSSNISTSTVFKFTFTGGGGGGSAGNAGGGGAGGTAIYYGSGLTALTAYSITVGAGGNGGVQLSVQTGSNGGTSSITINSTIVTAIGGFGGTPSTGSGSPGGNAINGTINLNGGDGYPESPPNGGNGGASFFGGGGRGGYGGGAVGFNAGVYGAGGGGGLSANGGNGKGGVVIIEWVE